MIFSKGKLAQKLLVLVFSISFLLIIGSFLYFYISAKSFLYNSGVKELEIYHSHFTKASADQIKEYNYQIDGLLIDLRLPGGDGQKEINKIKDYIRRSSQYDELYIYNKKNKRASIVTLVKVFGGEQIIRIRELSDIKFSQIFDSINTITRFFSNSAFGFINNADLKTYYIKKELEPFSIIARLNTLKLFDKIIERIYHPPKINFNIVNSHNAIEYSTNKYWVNQKLNKFLLDQELSKEFFQETQKNLICGNWESYVFQNRLIITNNYTEAYNSFYDIIFKLFFYSILILSAILIVTIFYTNQISKSLSEISKVTKSVSKGDFQNKINIRRNDELGMLINSFNDMVDNLQYSYNQLGITNKELQLKIEELVKTKTELTKQQKLALVGETISKISHEIQNKISGVSVWVQNLEMQKDLNETTLMYVAEIKRSLNSFVEMLLNFKKFYRKPFLEKSMFCLDELLIRIIEQYSADLNAKNISLEKNIDDNNHQISADINLLEELFVNIIVNAIYYCPNNGKISIKTKILSERLSIEIMDNGSGIESNEKENIFNPFFTTKASGSGLGLAISKNIVEAHLGQIEVENIRPTGALFRIIIPLNLE